MLTKLINKLNWILNTQFWPIMAFMAWGLFLCLGIGILKSGGGYEYKIREAIEKAESKENRVKVIEESNKNLRTEIETSNSYIEILRTQISQLKPRDVYLKDKNSTLPPKN